MPAVSVIIPTYNRACMVVEAVESVLKQTFRDFELLVIDDGSTDGTAECLAPFENRLRYIYQPNRGISAARNRGIREAQGEFLAFLDSDDLWLRRKLEVQMREIQRDPSVRICYTDEIWIRRGVRVNPKKKHQKYSGWILQKMLPLCIISPSSALIHRSVLEEIGDFDESLPACEDYDLWLRIGARYPIRFIPEPLIIKRGGHEDQLSRKYWGLDRFRIRALQKLLAQNELKPEDRLAAIRVLQEKCRILATGCFKRQKQLEGYYYLRIASQYQGEREALERQRALEGSPAGGN